MKRKNNSSYTDPSIKNPAHGEALEAARYAEAQLYRHINLDIMANAHGGRMAYIEAQPEYAALVKARDEARDAVAVAAEPAPKAKKQATK